MALTREEIKKICLTLSKTMHDFQDKNNCELVDLMEIISTFTSAHCSDFFSTIPKNKREHFIQNFLYGLKMRMERGLNLLDEIEKREHRCNK